MNTCILSCVVVGVTASLMGTPCQTAVSLCGENLSGAALVQEKAKPKFVRAEMDDSLIRMRLLMADAVQKDLGLTADQMGKISDCVKLSAHQLQELAAWPDDTSDVSEQRRRELQVRLENLQRRQKELMAQVIEALTPNQTRRLKQILVQQTVAFTLVKPEFIEALDITHEQLKKLRALGDRVVERASAKLQELDGLTAEERRKKFIELAKERNEAEAEANKLAVNVLNPEQRAKLEEFVGRMIEVTWDYGALLRYDGD